MNYWQAHRALERQRGKASEHPCVGCGEPARDWAYRNQSKIEKLSDEGYPYSEDPFDYDPMCRACHVKADVAHNPEPRSESGRRGGKVRLKQWQDEGRRKMLSTQRQCSCGRVFNPLHLGRHQQASGHTGWTAVLETESNTPTERPAG